MKTTIDSAGRLVIPRAIRRAAGLEAGASVEIRFVDGQIVIEPASASVRMERRGRFTAAVPEGDVDTPLTNEIVNQTREAVLDERMP